LLLYSILTSNFSVVTGYNKSYSKVIRPAFPEIDLKITTDFVSPTFKLKLAVAVGTPVKSGKNPA
jgi:hypothetical protein